MNFKQLTLSIITASLLAINSYAVSNTIGYQGVAVNNGTTVSNSIISLKFTILASDNTTVVYEETVSNVATNEKGFFSHNIGSGTALGTAWSDITWSDDYKLKVAVDLNNGSTYTDLGSKDLVSVAYAKKSAISDIASALASNPTACTSGQYVTDIAADGTLTCSTPIDTDTKVTVNNSLTSTSTTEALSAAQGKALNDGKLSTTGTAASATKLATAITIGGVSFDGSANIDLPGVNTAGNQNTTGNAATATKLATAKTINGVNFDGSANITVADDTKLPLSGGTMTGDINLGTNSITGVNATDEIFFDSYGYRVKIAGNNLMYISPHSLNKATWFNLDQLDQDFIVRSVNNTNMLRVDAANDRIGIGTNVPNQQLSVYNGNSGSQVAAQFANADTTISGGFLVGIDTVAQGLVYHRDAKPIRFATDGNDRMRITATGEIGIGTTAPATKLDVNGTAQASQFQLDSNAYMTLKTLTNPNFVLNFDVNDYLSFDRTDNAMKVNINGEKLRVTSAGAVGIGTNNPNQQLSVYNATGSSQVTAQFANADTTISGGFLVGIDTAAQGLVYHRDAKPIRFATNGIDRMRITSTGSIGIGTTSPVTKLHVNGTATTDKIIIDNGVADGGDLTLKSSGNIDYNIDNYYGDLRFFNGSTERMRLQSDGKLFVGKFSGTGAETVAIQGGIRVYGTYQVPNESANNLFNTSQASIQYNASGNTYNYSFRGDGDIIGSTIRAHSDKRIKTEINPISNALDTIKKIKPSSYKKIDKLKNADKTHYGFIAQELEKIIPEAVSQDQGEIPVMKKFDEMSFEDGVEYTILVKNDENIKQETYTTAQTKPQGEVFVLNKKVNDFRTVDYDMVFTHAVAALQEQQQIIETQNKKIDDLTNKLEAIESLLKKNGLVK